NHTRKELLFLMFKEINLRNHSSLHKLFYSLLISFYIIKISYMVSLSLKETDLVNF
ncbi:glycerophosphodiester phosphodiesterase, partial [Lactobacillus crispatus]|nr:glycerophosphodiester phosphodiesterase [Lactobacillus crispatus]